MYWCRSGPSEGSSRCESSFEGTFFSLPLRNERELDSCTNETLVQQECSDSAMATWARLAGEQRTMAVQLSTEH